MNSGRTVSVIVSGTVVLTRSCREECGYCSFRKNGDPLIPLSRLGDFLSEMAKGKATEAVLVAGQASYELPHILMGLSRDKCTSFGEYLHQACRMAAERGLIPVINAGIMTPLELRTLAPVAGAVHIPVLSAELEGPGQAHFKARGRTKASSHEMIEKAHQAEFPYRLDFLVGIGETEVERASTILEYGAFCAADPFLQDIRIIPFQPTPGTVMHDRPPLSFDSIRSSIEQASKAFPVHPISVPAHLFSRFPELIEAGLNDLSSLPMVTGDPVLPTFPVPSLEMLRTRLVETDATLYERLSLLTPAATNRSELAKVIGKARDKVQARVASGLNLLDNRACFVCGEHNPHGLQITFQRRDENTSAANWVPGPAFQGYAGILHGGIISALLDEAMANTISGNGLQVVTVDLRVRFHHPIPVGCPITILGTRTGNHARIHSARASILAPNGSVMAEAEGRFAEG